MRYPPELLETFQEQLQMGFRGEISTATPEGEEPIEIMWATGNAGVIVKQGTRMVSISAYTLVELAKEAGL